MKHRMSLTRGGCAAVQAPASITSTARSLIGAAAMTLFSLSAAAQASPPVVAPANALAGSPASSSPTDPRLREVTYEPRAVITLPMRRGEVTLVVLAADESIAEVAAGLGGDCNRAESPWCIVAQPGGRSVFIKPKSSAQATNNLAIVTDKRLHALQLQVLAEGDNRQPVHRLLIKPPAAKPATPAPVTPPPTASGAAAAPDPALFALASANAELITRLKAAAAPERVRNERLQARPPVHNSQYSLAEGKDSADIVPTMVFDDGRFTYLKFPGNREVPAVFHVQGDGSEALLNARMDDDLLVIDRVARRLVLRAGTAVVNVHNDAFDLDGLPPEDGTTVPGIRRVLKTGAARAGALAGGSR